MRHGTVPLFILLCLLSGVRLSAQSLMYEIQGAAPFLTVGSTIAVLGDVNGDGFQDFASGGPMAPENETPGQFAAFVRAYSGADGSVLYEHVTTVFSSPSLRVSLTNVGDLSGDGLPDLTLGMTDMSPLSTAPGTLQILDGATGTVLRSIQGTSAGSTFGYSVAPVGDLNGDGTIDLAVSAPAFSAPAVAFPEIRVLSGTTGVPFMWLGTGGLPPAGVGMELLFLGNYYTASPYPELAVGSSLGTWGGSSIATFSVFPLASLTAAGSIVPCAQVAPMVPGFGWRFADLGDLNGDGNIEFAAGHDALSGTTPQARVVIFSGGMGPCLQDLYLDSTGTCPFDLVGVPDMDGDGSKDLGIVDLTSGTAVQVISGTTAAPILTVPLEGNTCPSVCSGISDLNGDGLGDLVIGLPASGKIQVWSSASLPATAAVLGTGFTWAAGPAPLLSATPPILGQPVSFALTAGPPLAPAFFILSPGPANPVPIMPGFVIYPDLNALETWTVVSFMPAQTGSGSLSIFLPADLRLSGEQGVAQTWFPSPLGFSGAAISNGLQLTLGF